MGEYDRRLKGLVEQAPQDFVTWLIAGAYFKDWCATEFVSKEYIADELLLIEAGGKEYLLHIEFQKGYDANMAERMWQYKHLP